MLVFFCAELRRGSGEHAGNASSWQNKPPPPPQDLTPGRTAAKPADVYVTVFPQRAGRRSAHTLTDTDAHRSDKLSKCQQMLNPLAHTNPHTHPNTHCAPISFSCTRLPSEPISAAAGLIACCEAGQSSRELSKKRHARGNKPRGCFCVGASVTHQSPSVRDKWRAAAFSGLLPKSF